MPRELRTRTALRGPFPLCSRDELQEMLDETDETIDRLRCARPVSPDHAARIADAVARQEWWAAGIRAQLGADGSSNSNLIMGHHGEQYHGFIERGEWT